MKNAERPDCTESASLQDYKNKVRCCLLAWCGERKTDRFMKLYDEDLEMIYRDYKWSPGTAAFAILLGF